jgi:GR25 family glycosyltransferase involved in LPS biosynthesis
LSHNNIYKELLDSDEPWRLVAEDDIRVAEGFSECLASILGRLPAKWDWIKIEYSNGVAPEKHLRRRPSDCRIELYDALARPIHCAALYLVSRAGASLLLDVNGKGRTWCNADGAMDHYWIHLCTGLSRTGRAYHVVPQLAWQDTSFGDVGSHRQ